LVKARGFDYLCVTRSKLKKFDLDAAHSIRTVCDKKENAISLQKITVANETDYFLKIKSNTKALKEASMHAQFKQHFEEGLQIIEASLTKRSGVKKEDQYISASED